MTARRITSTVCVLFALLALVAFASPAEAKSELKGAAILDHACGKLAVKHMGLVHAGKMEEAVKLGTADMQKEWQAMPADDRKMMTGMMQEMAQSEEQFTADVKASGVLTVEEKSGTLEIVKETKDENGTSKETWSQKYVIDGASCQITH
jgi:hypothetical protein